MTNYNDGKWHGWDGGNYPVHPKTTVEVVYLVNATSIVSFDTGRSVKFNWNASYAKIVAFRVVKEHKEPREFWIKGGVAYGWLVPYAVHVKEVMDNE